MSSRRWPLAFSRQAQRDLHDILQHTFQEWGPEQQDRYASQLEDAIELLRDHPQAGRSRDDIRPGYRLYPVGQHLICYRVTSRTLRVLRILHQRRDLGRVLGRSR